ncbi:MAG TPA: T9SS type A sorting domain-containing protein [Bacteroidales bacterium]|nr:T9SS type A sorting domain-containing protein [Bacteroidales bacterium]
MKLNGYFILVLLLIMTVSLKSQTRKYIDKNETDYPYNNYQWLDVNHINAIVPSAGAFFKQNDTGEFTGGYLLSNINYTPSIFAGSIWVGGIDENDIVHLSGERFNQVGKDYYPGPLQTSGMAAGTSTPEVMSEFDKVWKIDRADLLNYLANGTNTNDIENTVYTWPAHGPTNYSQELAPFVDLNNNGIYEPETNDEYPNMLGDQMLYRIYNDNKTNSTSETGGIALGIEIEDMHYGFRYDNPSNPWQDLINYQTFQKVCITNRSDTNYNDVYIGIFLDGDIGYAWDDYIGTSVYQQSLYFYNGDDYDEGTDSTNGFGSNLPVQTVTVLSSLSPTESGSFTVTNPLSAAFYFNNTSGSNPATSDPTNASEYYSYLQGKWKDGSDIYYGGTGHISHEGTSDVPTDYVFPGASDPNGIGTNGIQMEAWSEITESNLPDDRRGLLVAGPYTLAPGDHEKIELVYAHIPANLISSTKNAVSIPEFQPALDTVINWHLHDRIPSNYAAADSLSFITGQKSASGLSVYPNPAKNILHIQAPEALQDISISDISGRPVLGEQIAENTKKITLDVSKLKSGYYLLSVTSGNKLSTRKIVIE